MAKDRTIPFRRDEGAKNKRKKILVEMRSQRRKEFK